MLSRARSNVCVRYAVVRSGSRGSGRHLGALRAVGAGSGGVAAGAGCCGGVRGGAGLAGGAVRPGGCRRSRAHPRFTSATPSAARGASPEGFLLIWPAMGLDARFSAAWFHPVPTPHIPHRRQTGCAQRPCLENPNMGHTWPPPRARVDTVQSRIESGTTRVPMRANRHVPDVCDDLNVLRMDSFGLNTALNFSTSWRKLLGLRSPFVAFFVQ
jgi:hypothetical protein